MSYQSNGIVSNGLPSLYDEVPDTQTTDKSLSILSAVTGKEVTRPAGQQHSSSVPPRTVFLYTLFIATMLGFTYWQYNRHENSWGFATAVTPNPVANKAPQPTTATLPVTAGNPAPQAKMDTALIETVKEKSATSSPFELLQADSKSTVVTKEPLIAGQVEKPGKPTLTASSTVIAKKPVKNEIATKDSPAKTVNKSISPGRVAHTEKTGRSAQLKQPAPTNKAAAPARPVQRTTVTSAQDPDEKLLEGMLRLMKRDHSADAAQGRTAR